MGGLKERGLRTPDQVHDQGEMIRGIAGQDLGVSDGEVTATVEPEVVDATGVVASGEGGAIALSAFDPGIAEPGGQVHVHWAVGEVIEIAGEDDRVGGMGE